MISRHGPAARQSRHDLGDDWSLVVSRDDDGDFRRIGHGLAARPRSILAGRCQRREFVPRFVVIYGIASGPWQFERAHSIQEILEQFAIGRYHVCQQADEEHLKSDNHEDCAQDQGLKISARRQPWIATYVKTNGTQSSRPIATMTPPM